MGQSRDSVGGQDPFLQGNLHKTYKIFKKYFISLDEYKKPCYYIADAAQRGLRA